MDERYYIDERAGCIAVRDRTMTIANEPGLHSDTMGVIRFWHGDRTSHKCTECGHHVDDGWMIPEAARQAARELCDRLNANGTPSA